MCQKGVFAKVGMAGFGSWTGREFVGEIGKAQMQVSCGHWEVEQCSLNCSIQRSSWSIQYPLEHVSFKRGITCKGPKVISLLIVSELSFSLEPTSTSWKQLQRDQPGMSSAYRWLGILVPSSWSHPWVGFFEASFVGVCKGTKGQPPCCGVPPRFLPRSLKRFPELTSSYHGFESGATGSSWKHEAPDPSSFSPRGGCPLF